MPFKRRVAHETFAALLYNLQNVLFKELLDHLPVFSKHNHCTGHLEQLFWKHGIPRRYLADKPSKGTLETFPSLVGKS